MFRDQSLIPSEALRLAALGIVAEGGRDYAEVAGAVRHFAARMTGPSLDLMGTSLELLRYEGLIAPEPDAGNPNRSVFVLTAAGRSVLRDLMLASVRGPVGGVSRLVVALKIRFLPLLDAADRAAAMDGLIEAAEGDVARLADLAGQSEGSLGDWLAQEKAEAERRLAWFRDRRGVL